MARNFYITTPIFYPNAKLHMGHAYTTTLSDILARYHRLKGEHTYLLTGSDENTQKMVDSARKAGKDPIVFLDEIVLNFRALYKTLNISYDQFIRTTDQINHWPGAQFLWSKLTEAGDIYKKEYEGLYCIGHEAFITEKELVDGVCPDHGTKPELVREENYFFKLSRYADMLKEKIESDELRIIPETRKNEILSFIKEGLEDVSFSRPRRSEWPQGLGIPVPGDPSQVMYVWCDALSNYITALGYGRDEALFKQFWPVNVHVIGKDILRFHAAIWPAMLLSAGIPLPRSLLVHGFITSGGKKMSKTLGNIIDPEDLLSKYGTDAVRYYLARHISPYEDGDLTQEGFHEAYIAHLSNGLGNQVSRIMKLASDHLSGPLDVSSASEVIGGGPFGGEFEKHLESYQVNAAMDIIFEHIGKADLYIQGKEPYKKIKSENEKEREHAKSDIEKLVRHLWLIAIHLEPFMPETAQKIKEAVRANTQPASLFPRID